MTNRKLYTLTLFLLMTCTKPAILRELYTRNRNGRNIGRKRMPTELFEREKPCRSPSARTLGTQNPLKPNGAGAKSISDLKHKTQ